MTTSPQASEGQKDRAAYDAANAQAAAVAGATARNTPTGNPRDLALVHEALTPLPEFASSTDDGSQAMPARPWEPGMPIPARHLPALNPDSTVDNKPAPFLQGREVTA